MRSRIHRSPFAAMFAIAALAHMGIGCGTKADKPAGATTPETGKAPEPIADPAKPSEPAAVVAEKPEEP